VFNRSRRVRTSASVSWPSRERDSAMCARSSANSWRRLSASSASRAAGRARTARRGASSHHRRGRPGRSREGVLRGGFRQVWRAMGALPHRRSNRSASVGYAIAVSNVRRSDR
jgi:hypothetical protein